MNHLTLNRRDFLKSSAASVGVVALGSTLPPSVLGANGRINVGIIGVGGKGMDHLRWLRRNAKDENVRIAAVSAKQDHALGCRKRATRLIELATGANWRKSVPGRP